MSHRLSLLAVTGLILAACAPTTSLPRTALPPANVQTQSTGSAIDDSDISAGFRPQTAGRLEQEAVLRQGKQLTFATQTRPGILGTPARPLPRNMIGGRLLYTDAQNQQQPAALATATLYQNNRRVASALTDADGAWQLPQPPAGTYELRYTLENPRWQISRYSWQGPTISVPGNPAIGDTLLSAGSQNGQAAWIHEVYLKALKLFEREQVPLDWWKRQIQTVWPGQGDYYTSYTVTLTGAEQWDVNGHEVGHAIYHQALNARSQGGQHKIDDCYSPTLALSEGFATFFSGAVHLSKDDPDARFAQYLVPRRAPIRIENVPADVCPGSRNEWRVASVFWDVYDSHNDGPESLNLGLNTIFNALGQSSKPTATSALDAYGLLRDSLPVTQHAALEQVFRHNTMEISP